MKHLMRHDTEIELSAKGCYYAWCANPDCYWQSPYRKALDAVRAYALKHEKKAERTDKRSSPRANLAGRS